MTFTDSRLGPGTLTIGATFADAGCQLSNVRLVPDHNEEDGTKTLCDPDPVPLLSTTWSLQGDAVQDWENADGFVEHARTHNGEVETFSWVPNTDIGVTYSGECQVRAIEIGGDVGEQNTSAFEWPVKGDITRTEAAAPGGGGA